MKGQKAPWEGVFTRYSRWDEVILAADNAVDFAEDFEIDRVWRACTPWIPANDKSGYTAAERSKARYRRASIMMEVGYAFLVSSSPASFRYSSYHQTCLFSVRKNAGLGFHLLGVYVKVNVLISTHGEWGFACADLETALRDAPGDMMVISAFQKAKEKYDPAVRPGAALRRLGVYGW